LLGWQFKQELEHVHTVQDLARHLEEFLNAGYAVWRDAKGALVLLPDTVALEPFQSFTLELVADEQHRKFFRVKGKELDATFDIFDCSLIRGSVKRKVGGFFQKCHGMKSPLCAYL
jgi:hypothetical protein